MPSPRKRRTGVSRSSPWRGAHHEQYVHRGLFGYPRYPLRKEKKLGRKERAMPAEPSSLQMLQIIDPQDPQFRLLADLLPQIVWTADPNGYQDFFNRRWFEHTGFTEEETYAGKTALHPDDFPQYVKRWSRALREGKPYEAEYRILYAPEKIYRWYLVRGVPLRDARGRIVKWFGTFTDIHTVKMAEQALRESEERYRALVDAGPDAIIVHRNNRFHYANAAALRLYGARSFRQLASRKVLDLVAKGERRGAAERVHTAMQGRLLPRRELRILRLDGREIPVEVIAAPVDAGGRRVVQAIIRDITDRKQREEELQKLNRTLLALNSSNQAMMRATNEGGYLADVCKIIVKDCGYAMVWIGYAEHDARKSVQPVAYAGFEDGYLEKLRVTWADTQRGRGPTGTAIRTKKPRLCRKMLTDPRFGPWRKEALQRGYSSSIALPLIADGAAFGALTIYSREPDPFSAEEVALLSELADDLSYGISAIRLRLAHARAAASLRRSEEQLRKMNEGLERSVAERTKELAKLRQEDQENLQRIKDMIGSMTAAVVASDENLRVLFVNEPFCRLFKLGDPDEVRGKSAIEIMEHADDLFQDPEKAREAVFRSWTEKQPLISQEIALKDGRVFSRDYIPVFTDGKFSGQFVLWRDVTREKRIDAAKSDFMSFASHQLRTPLTAIRWALGRLQKDLREPTEEQRRLVEAGRRAVRTMADTINTMLSISRIEAGTVTLSVTPVSLCSLLDDVRENLRTESVQRHQRVTLRCPPSLTFRTDEKLLREAIGNLLSNAIKYSPEGSSVAVRAEAAESGVRIAVEDRGFGIPAHERGRVFEKFYRGDNAVQALADGSGLGLYLVSLLVRTLGGQISFVSEEGKGTTFTILLPREIVRQ